MLRRFGNLVWKQSREMSVLNYSNHLVYEIYTNHGYLYIAHDKSTGKVELTNGVSLGFQDLETQKSSTNKNETIFLPTLE